MGDRGPGPGCTSPGHLQHFGYMSRSERGVQGWMQEKQGAPLPAVAQAEDAFRAHCPVSAHPRNSSLNLASV